jgi:ferredoxin--NADP+ reductase
MAKWLNGKVVSNNRWNERLTSLKFEAPLENFESGQFVRVGIEIDGDVVARPYSLVNSPGESALEIYFNIVPEGPLSPRLFELETGDDIMVATRPAGFLTISEVPESNNLWMLATGTAIGPFLSILKGQAVWQKFEQITLCYSVRTQEELAYADEILQIATQRKSQFCFIPIITREDAPNTLRERIPQAINNGNLELRANTSLSADDSHVMMCGSSEMITEVSTLLESRGMRKHRRREPGHFTTEKYH